MAVPSTCFITEAIVNAEKENGEDGETGTGKLTFGCSDDGRHPHLPHQSAAIRY